MNQDAASMESRTRSELVAACIPDLTPQLVGSEVLKKMVTGIWGLSYQRTGGVVAC